MMRIKKVVIDKANRLFQLPPLLSAFYRNQKKPTLLKKTRMLDLASFKWPISFSDDSEINPDNLQPITTAEKSELSEQLAEWLSSYHGTRLNPELEIFVGGSVSRSLLSLSLALVDPGDLVFVPELAVPLYRSVIAAAGGQTVFYPLDPREGYKPDLDRINSRVGRVARFLFLNQPHNPTGAELSQQEMEHLVYYASRENIAIINDAAYQSIPGRKAVSLLSVAGGKLVGAEIYSFAYLLGLPHIGLGFVAGNREVISALKSAAHLNQDYFPRFYLKTIQRAIRQFPSDDLKQVRQRIHRSSQAATKLLEILALDKISLDNTPFVWAKITRRGRASEAAAILYRRSRVMTTPGTAFGETGEGYLRCSLTAPAEDFEEACTRAKARRPLLKTEDES